MMFFTTFVFQNGYRLFMTRGVDTSLPEMSRSIMTEGGHDLLRSRKRLPHVRPIVAKIVNSIPEKTEVGIRVPYHISFSTLAYYDNARVHEGDSSFKYGTLYRETSARVGSSVSDPHPFYADPDPT
jgi:hypothetical protein